MSTNIEKANVDLDTRRSYTYHLPLFDEWLNGPAKDFANCVCKKYTEYIETNLRRYKKENIRDLFSITKKYIYNYDYPGVGTDYF